MPWLSFIRIWHKCNAPLAIELRSHPRTKGTVSQRSLRICWYFYRGCVDDARVLANQDASTYARLCSDGERGKYAAQALLPRILSGRPATTRLLAQLKSNIYRAVWQTPAPESHVQSCISLVLGTVIKMVIHRHITYSFMKRALNSCSVYRSLKYRITIRIIRS